MVATLGMHELTERCYEYKGLPAEQQVSVFPTPDREGQVTFWEGYFSTSYAARQEVSSGRFAQVDAGAERVALPLQWCVKNCSNHGMCLTDKAHNHRPFCSCHQVGGGVKQGLPAVLLADVCWCER